MQLSLLQSDTSSDPLLIRFSTELFEAVTNVTFSGDVPVIVDSLQTAINLLSEANLQGDIPVSYEVGSGIDKTSTAPDVLSPDLRTWWK